MLRALLDISKLDAGGIQPNPERVPLAPLLRDIAEGIRPLAEEKGLRLVVGPLAGAVMTDPGLLRSVLQNLLANAVRYTAKGGIVVGVRRRGDALRIDVIDSGVGIPESQQRAIFSEFTRLGEVDAEGLGLGLAIVDRIARLLDLRMELVSHPGRGSRFSVALPGVAMPRTAALAPVLAPADKMRALTVLVVDNDPAIVEANAALLAEMGHVCIGVGKSDEALAKAARADVAFIDYHLDAGEDGMQLVDRLRRAHPHLAIAMITAEGGAQLRRRAKRRGIGFFVKPVAAADLEAFLAQAAAASAALMCEIEP